MKEVLRILEEKFPPESNASTPEVIAYATQRFGLPALREMREARERDLEIIKNDRTLLAEELDEQKDTFKIQGWASGKNEEIEDLARKSYEANPHFGSKKPENPTF